MSGPREGYPRVADPEHPLWAAQENGWPDHLPHEAWAALAQHAQRRFVSSSQHPAFATNYLVNTEATQPDPPPLEPAVDLAPAPKERR